MIIGLTSSGFKSHHFTASSSSSLSLPFGGTSSRPLWSFVASCKPTRWGPPASWARIPLLLLRLMKCPLCSSLKKTNNIYVWIVRHQPRSNDSSAMLRSNLNLSTCCSSFSFSVLSFSWGGGVGVRLFNYPPTLTIKAPSSSSFCSISFSFLVTLL